MLSKNKSRFLISLQKKKVRESEGLFIIEGDKLVREFITAGVPLVSLVAKREFISSLGQSAGLAAEHIEASYEELKQVSTLKTPHNALAVVQIPSRSMTVKEIIKGNCAALDCVQDPGNLGTIIRAAAWFGIKNIVCSNDCVDAYNPKVIQATMGAILHVNIWYKDLRGFFSEVQAPGTPVYGTVLDGVSLYSHNLARHGIILLGNESKGISEDLRPFITHRIKIPGITPSLPGIESLNVGMAAAVVFSEFHRQSLHPIPQV